jgi:SPP1 family predicted phage head-tail adaptor
MRIGKLNRRVSIQACTAVQDDAGQEVATWTEVAKPWANVRFLNGKEYSTSGTMVSGATVSIQIRYRTDLDATMRVVQGSTIYNVLAVLPDEEDRDYLYLACNTGINNG